MAKYIIDTETGTCVPYSNVEVKSSNTIGEKIISFFQSHRGVVEYNGIVATIQKWYYGALVQASWCATAMSYAIKEVCGLNITKQENVYLLLNELNNSGLGNLYMGSAIPSVKKGDILFWLWSGSSMSTTSNKHVGVAEIDSNNDTIYCLGGNQKDKICTLAYNRKYLYAIYRFN